MKTSIRKYLLATLVLIFFAGAGLLPLLADSKSGGSLYSLQKDNAEKETGKSGSADESNVKEWLSENSGMEIPEWNLSMNTKKYFISNSSLNSDCFIQVITPPPEQF